MKTINNSQPVITNTHPVTDADLQQFCTDQHDRYKQWLGRIGCSSTLRPEAHHEASRGSRYARISCHDSQVMSVCFIDLSNGDILKGSWKAPVKNGVRGNIFTEDRGASCMDGTGPKYLR